MLKYFWQAFEILLYYVTQLDTTTGMQSSNTAMASHCHNN